MTWQRYAWVGGLLFAFLLGLIVSGPPLSEADLRTDMLTPNVAGFGR